MTSGERDLIAQLSEYMREWRTDDKVWKDSTDKRLTKVEQYIVATQAREKAQADMASAQGLTRRARITLAVTAASAIGSLILGIVNALH